MERKPKTITRIILNIIAILLMITGPILMILPGPQLLSWLGLALFIYANKSWLKKFKWFRKCELKLELWKIHRSYIKKQKQIYNKYKKGKIWD